MKAIEAMLNQSVILPGFTTREEFMRDAAR